jgi:two-component system NtrC family response regulator
VISETARILIVDDDPEFRDSLRKTLTRAGYEVSTAADGLQATTMLLEQFYPLILLDIRMPGKSGFDVLTEVKAKSPASKVIMITANGDNDIFKQSEQCGAFAFLNKPLKRQKILKYTELALKPV